MMHGIPMPVDSDYPQTISISYGDVPEARDWKIDEEYDLMIRVKQISMNTKGATFEIIEAKAGNGE